MAIKKSQPETNSAENKKEMLCASTKRNILSIAQSLYGIIPCLPARTLKIIRMEPITAYIKIWLT